MMCVVRRRTSADEHTTATGRWRQVIVALSLNSQYGRHGDHRGDESGRDLRPRNLSEAALEAKDAANDERGFLIAGKTSFRDDTVGAVAAIEEISEIIGRISEFQTTIASAVEEQTVTTNEMSRNVTEAADAGSRVAGTIGELASSV
jgi:hypothetical protein